MKENSFPLWKFFFASFFVHLRGPTKHLRCNPNWASSRVSRDGPTWFKKMSQAHSWHENNPFQDEMGLSGWNLKKQEVLVIFKQFDGIDWSNFCCNKLKKRSGFFGHSQLGKILRARCGLCVVADASSYKLPSRVKTSSSTM